MDAKVETSPILRPVSEASWALDTLESISTSSPCFIAGVPVEVLILILSHAVSGSNKTLLTLCGVCRRWREILLNVPHVWKNLILTGNSYWTPDKVDAWLKRARGSLSRIYLRGECKVLTEDDLYKRIPWSSLRELCVINCKWTPRDYFLPEIASQLQIESFILSEDVLLFPSFLGRGKTERLRSLVCKVTHGGPPLANIASSSLTRLELSGYYAISELLVLLDRNPMIERMVLAVSSLSPEGKPIIGASSIELMHLTHLELCNCYRMDTILRAIHFPNVRTLILGYSVNSSCMNIIATRWTPHLEEFELANTSYDHRDLIPFLRNALALKTLSIFSYEVKKKEDLVIQALAEVLSQESITTPCSVGMLCCPRLQEVELHAQYSLSASLILELVRTRLNGVSNTRISRLYLYELPPNGSDARFSLSEQDMEWLRSNVPDFQYERSRYA